VDANQQHAGRHLKATNPLESSAGENDRESDAMLRLSATPGLGPVRVERLVQHFGSASATLAAPARALQGVLRRNGIPAAIAQSRTMDTRGWWRRARAVGARAVVRTDAGYPKLLAQLYDPPPILWVRGEFPAPDAACAAIVGTRRATPYGRRLARDIAADLASRGVWVISGMALGIDGEAHEGALAAGGRTLAILGSGIDRIYPRTHYGLARRIETSGGLVSEFPPGSAARPGNFPRRNRIIAGLCSATVVIEAYEKGGALITAKMALDQNREVFVAPGSIRSDASRGAHMLVRDGEARLLVGVSDVADSLWPTRSTEPVVPPSMTDPESHTLRFVSHEPVDFDSLCTRTGMDASGLLVALLGLEFAGMVRQLAGRQFYRTTAADAVVPFAGSAGHERR
jgi:DNA processing protein